MFRPDTRAGAYGGVIKPNSGTSVSFVRSNPRAFQFLCERRNSANWGPYGDQTVVPAISII